MSDPVRDMDRLWYEDNFGNLWGAHLENGVLIPTGELRRELPPLAPPNLSYLRWYEHAWYWVRWKFGHRDPFYERVVYMFSGEQRSPPQ